MFIVATWTGSILWHLFVKLDSDRFPVRTYSDLVERIFGTWARHLCTILQSIQLIINVGLICLSSGQSLSQVSLYVSRLSIAHVLLRSPRRRSVQILP